MHLKHYNAIDTDNSRLSHMYIVTKYSANVVSSQHHRIDFCKVTARRSQPQRITRRSPRSSMSSSAQGKVTKIRQNHSNSHLHHVLRAVSRSMPLLLSYPQRSKAQLSYSHSGRAHGLWKVLRMPRRKTKTMKCWSMDHFKDRRSEQRKGRKQMMTCYGPMT